MKHNLTTNTNHQHQLIHSHLTSWSFKLKQVAGWLVNHADWILLAMIFGVLLACTIQVWVWGLDGSGVQTVNNESCGSLRRAC